VFLILQAANELLGYGKGELEGKPVSWIMPAPFSTNHSMYIRQYLARCVTKQVQV